jgi:4-diphosphocytidyl-2C-methyl-D-erythritol kinase
MAGKDKRTPAPQVAFTVSQKRRPEIKDMTNNTRHLANLSGYGSCLCTMCHSKTSRKFYKLYNIRAVRRSKNKVIIEGINNG